MRYSHLRDALLSVRIVAFNNTDSLCSAGHFVVTTHPHVNIRRWIQAERQGQPEDPLFTTSRGRTLSRDAVGWLLSKHVTNARERLPSLGAKTITPHVLRHSAAMRLLHAGVDPTVIAMWLGHEKAETVEVYLHADMAMKERALARTAPLTATARRYRPPDALLTFLESL